MAYPKRGMIVAIVAVSAALPCFGQRTPKQQRTNSVAGMWRPVSLKSTLSNVTSQPFGLHPDGLLELNGNLHFVEWMINPDVLAFAAPDPQNGTPKEIRTAFLD